MAFLLSHCPRGWSGFLAPPADSHAPKAAPAPLQRLSPSWQSLQKEGLPPCTTSAQRRRLPTAGGGPSSDASADSSRAARLFELDREGGYTASSSATSAPAKPQAGGSSTDDMSLLDAGWGVVTVSPPSSAPKPSAKRAKGKPKAPSQAPPQPQLQSQTRTRGTPFVDKSSEAGLLGLTLLQQRLADAGLEAHSPEQKAKIAVEAAARRERLAKTTRRKRDWVDPDDLDVGEGEAEEMSLDGDEQQVMELTLDAEGNTEIVEFDERGRVKARRAPGEQASQPVAGRDRRSSRRAGRDADDDDDPLAFLSVLEDDGNGPDEAEDPTGSGGAGRRASSGAAAGPSRGQAAAAAGTRTASDSSGGRRRSLPYDDDDGDVDADGRPMPGRYALADEEIEWGLDELRPAGRSSLLRELGVIKPGGKKQADQAKDKGKDKKAPEAQAAAGKAAPDRRGSLDSEDDGEDGNGSRDLGVAWGGSGGASGIDMEQQEALLARIFKPHKVRELMAHQRAAEAEMAALKKKTTGRAANESRIDTRMKIVGGSAAGKSLVAAQGNTTRPMMEKVRQAIFNMMQARSGGVTGLPPTSRWLDCFAGTGSVGLEALSRGSRECHFVELDSFVCRKVLSRNIATCGFQRQAVVHNMKAEDFLRRAIDLPRFAGGAFDFISVCPPYLLVSYPELMDLLERSPLINPERTIVFVEYPKQLAHEVPPTLGSLVTVRDRKYGRTYIRVFGPVSGPAGDDEEEAAAGGSDADGGDDGDELLL